MGRNPAEDLGMRFGGRDKCKKRNPPEDFWMRSGGKQILKTKG
jgi:hypothetical protein